MNSRRRAVMLDRLIEAMEKLSRANGERQNAIAFIESCYAGLVRSYDFDAALASLRGLTDEEHRALIEHVLRSNAS